MATEKRLIDADAVVKKLENEIKLHCHPVKESATGIEAYIERVLPGLLQDVINYLNKQPTVDAVEVVRCKDCKHYVLHALACRHENFNGTIPMNGYCYYGERKNE